ncbi:MULTISPECIES: type IV pili methyl-accepting chemotaxis transducer N-terminal domain-containing protein [Comamonas]|uniref:type IV pili methyl-accepting chemotaxis transducer N-terminal domain-containing protein n=1 Tax=Comamonas TaxID=283 RepID=UPI0015FABE3E|nr:type IV pili methyl-accepting chemotaxis transducer N-terminal domain-containing protein [Comamonas koreensis]
MKGELQPARQRPLAVKIGAIGCALLLMALVAIGLTLRLTWSLEGGAAAVNEAGRMRMQTWQLAQALPEASPQRLALLIGQLDTSLALLEKGDAARPLSVPRDKASRAALQAVQQRWQRLRAAWQQPVTGSHVVQAEVTAQQAQSFVGEVDHLVGRIEQQLARWTTWLNTAQFVMMALAIAAALALLYAAQLLVFGPLARLQTALAQVEAGDLSVRVHADGGDEFGALARGFNRMAVRLQDLYASLERRVQQKTEHLQAERARLAVLYDAAALVARADALPVLAQGFAAQMRKTAQADAVALRWSDEHNRRYVLLASEGLPEEMVDAEHCLPTGDCVCGQPQAQAQTQLVALQDWRRGVPAAAGRVDAGQCRRAGFVSVLSVPVRLHERMVGEVDLFFRQATMLAPDDRALLDALASHLAGGMEGLRADALQREAAVADERGLLARELHDSIAQSLAFLKIQAGLLRSDMARLPPDGARVQATLGELDTGIRESLSDVRELLLHFRTRTNAEDIVPALRTTLTKFEHQTGLPAQLQIAGEGMALPPDVQVQVLHVVQEALSNVRKHAQASQVWVEVEQGPQWAVEVRDDGQGMAQAALALDETHVGLRIMRERAAGIGASLEIHSVPGAGTCVRLSLPRLQPLQPLQPLPTFQPPTAATFATSRSPA